MSYLFCGNIRIDLSYQRVTKWSKVLKYFDMFEFRTNLSDPG